MTNQEKRSAVIGMILGDAHISKECRLSMGHSEQQKDYLFFKKRILQEIQKPEIKPYQTISSGKYINWRLATRKRPMYIWLRKRFYPNGIKTIKRKWLEKLTPLGIAIWFMDDGSTSYKIRNEKIHAVETTINTYLSKEQNEIIINYFKERWGIQMGLNRSRGKYRIRIGTKEARKFVKIIEPYIIPLMKYKIKKLLI